MAALLLGGSFLRCRTGVQRSVIPRTQSSWGRQRVNGVDLHFERAGEGQHGVLLLPGALGSSRSDFGPQLESLSKQRFTVVGWDPRGNGRSRPPDRDFPPDFFERDAKDAVDLMKALGFASFSLLGWSDGGISALIAAAKNPEKIRKMVVWGSNAFVSQQDMQLYEAVRDVSRWSARMRRPMEEMYGAEVFANMWEAWVDGMSGYAQRPGGSICMELLPLIRCPTLIIHGEKDPMVPRFHPQYLLKHIKGSRKMNGREDGSVGGCITVHNFSEKILEQLVHFHVMKLNSGFFLWVGSSPELSNLAVSMCSRYDSVPLSTLVLGDPSNTAANALAQRLAKKTQKQVYVSYSLPVTDPTMSLLVENRIKKELELHPELF